jgi:hypothetical protein
LLEILPVEYGTNRESPYTKPFFICSGQKFFLQTLINSNPFTSPKQKNRCKKALQRFFLYQERVHHSDSNENIGNQKPYL